MTGLEVKLSRFLSLVLRHQPSVGRLELDSEGWAEIDALVEGANKSGHAIDAAAIRHVVATNDKQRFEISTDGRRIRALQGHSTESVDRTFDPRVPPERLFHGTASRFVASILRDGLVPKGRHHVHLSHDRETAAAVGRRHGTPAVFAVAAGRMHGDGYEFYQAENGVWLTATVPARFLMLL